MFNIVITMRLENNNFYVYFYGIIKLIYLKIVWQSLTANAVMPLYTLNLMSKVEDKLYATIINVKQKFW